MLKNMKNKGNKKEGITIYKLKNCRRKFMETEVGQVKTLEI